MRQIYLLPQLSINDGVITADGQKVHIRQGEIDGACGPYSLIISLLIEGVITYDEVANLNSHDGRTRLGKFLDNLFMFGALVRKGTEYKDLSWLGECFKNHPKGRVTTSYVSNTTLREKIDTAVDALNESKPVIIGLTWQGGGGHWCVAVGYEMKDRIVTKLFTLDPGFSYVANCYWNGIVEAFNDDGQVKHPGRLSCSYLTANPLDERKCQVDDLIILNIS